LILNHRFTHALAAVTLALAAAFAVQPGALAASKGTAAPATPSPSPAPLPTASPEPPSVAIPRLESVIQKNPNDKESMADLAGYYLAVGRAPQALTLTQRLLTSGDKTAQIYYLDGTANQSLGRIKEATDDFENASNLEPTNATILVTLTNLYLQTNRPADAERVAKRATTFNKDDERAWMNYGLVLAEEKKYDDARVQFETAAKLDPKDPGPIVLEARSYTAQNAVALGLQEYDRALALNPKYPDALLGKARLYAMQHDVKNSIATYEQLLAIVPNDDEKASVVLEEFAVYRAEKMDSDANATIKRAVDTWPKLPGPHIVYGDYLNAQKDQAGAAREWNIALGPNRDNPDALQRLADLSLVQNKPQDAVGYTKRLTEISPNDPGAWLAYGQTLAFTRQWPAARDAFRHSFEVAHTPQALAGIATADYQMKNSKECAQIFDAIDKNVPIFLKQNAQLYFVMGDCYRQSGQRDKAKSAYQRLQPYLKPGSQIANDVKKILADLNAPAATAAKPKPSATPKR
jgi:tetratricopeptide (TPR) repeat protein